MTARPIDWLWPGRVARRKLTLIDGKPDVGKSLVSIEIAARLTTGHPMPDAERALIGPSGVLVIGGLEDDLADTVKPRFVAAGGDPARLYVLRGVDLASDPDTLRQAIDETGAVLVLVDRAMDLLTAKTSEISTKDAQQGLGRIVEVLAETDAAMIGLRHEAKAANGRAAVDRGLGSASFGGTARFVLGLVRDPDFGCEGEPSGRRVLGYAKANVVADANRRSLKLDIVSEVVEVDGLAIEVPVLRWLGLDPRSLDEVHAQAEQRSREQNDPATAWLLGHLADGGDHPSADVKIAAEAAGITERTLKRKVAKLRDAGRLVVLEQGFPRRTTWALVGGATGGHPGPSDLTGPTGDANGASKASGASKATLPPSGPNAEGWEQAAADRARPGLDWQDDARAAEDGQ